jgi:amidase
MAVTSFADVARLPEITLPLAQVDGIPVGLSLAAGHYQDEFLLDACRHLWG